MACIASTFQKQIFEITKVLIESSLSVEQNFPSLNNGNLYITDASDISITLKNLSYSDIYNELDKNKNYNVKLIDGALIQFMYSFDKNTLRKYRLAFFPSPSLEEFQNNAEIYEMDEIYADILLKNIIPTPIRFDYDPESAIDLEHPASHLTIGQYKNCRIPIFGAVTPNMFIDFILRNFYNTAKNKFPDKLQFSLNKYHDDCITKLERTILHLNI